MDRWRQYFEELLLMHEAEGIEPVKEGNNYPQDQRGDERLVEEFVEALGMLKKGTTAGHGRITGEMLKNVGPRGIEILTAICI
ncbi:hypothetical protein QE152_g35605 [Popillia japonica]|uniref:Uncharacterized protein n=1 Tax=Popillia japonica TaxID=7064 RepID=A0AAW1IFQ9_POPJA